MTSLTTKELSFIEDQLKCEQTMICKCKAFAEQTQDQALRSKFDEIANRHQKHYDKLYSLLG